VTNDLHPDQSRSPRPRVHGTEPRASGVRIAGKPDRFDTANRAIAVADGSKLGQVHLGHVAPLSAVDVPVTGTAEDDRVLERFRRAGLEVLCVEP
jgi:hypothetical protein